MGVDAEYALIDPGCQVSPTGVNDWPSVIALSFKTVKSAAGKRLLGSAVEHTRLGETVFVTLTGVVVTKPEASISRRGPRFSGSAFGSSGAFPVRVDVEVIEAVEPEEPPEVDICTMFGSFKSFIGRRIRLRASIVDTGFHGADVLYCAGLMRLETEDEVLPAVLTVGWRPLSFAGDSYGYLLSYMTREQLLTASRSLRLDATTEGAHRVATFVGQVFARQPVEACDDLPVGGRAPGVFAIEGVSDPGFQAKNGPDGRPISPDQYWRGVEDVIGCP